MAQFTIWKTTTGDQSIPIGSVEWTPEDWSHETEDRAVAALLTRVHAEGGVDGFKSTERDGVVYDFAPDRVEASDAKFMRRLSDFVLRYFERPDEPAIWIQPA